LTTYEGLQEEEYQELDESFIKQIAGDTTEEPDFLWIRGQLFNPATKQLKEPVINIFSEVHHLSDLIFPTIRDSSLDDMIEEAVEESPLVTQEQREILRSLLEHYEDIFATCLDDVGTANYKPFHVDIKPGSSMIKSKPYDLGIVMNEIVTRELERYAHAGILIPGNSMCTAPVFLVCIPRNKGSQKIKELKQCFSRNFNLDSAASVTELADAIEQDFSITMVRDFSNKFQCGLFRIRALFASLQPPGHSGISLVILFLNSIRLTRARWEVLGHVSWFEEPATAFGTGPFLQVTLLCPLGTKPEPNEDGD